MKTPLSFWLPFMRVKTLTASLIPFVAGSALARAAGAELHLFLLLSALATAFSIQIGTNLINDAIDYEKGADNSERLGPQRGIQTGRVTSREIYCAGLSSFALALLCAIPLILHGGIAIAIVVAISIACGYSYTGGPFPLAYVGLGDLFVFPFFGWVATMAAYWIQTGTLNFQSFLLGTQIGSICTVLIAVNNLRDIEGDAKVGKKTLAVRFGKTFSRIEIATLAVIPYALGFIWLKWGYYYPMLLPWLAFPLAQILIKKIYQTEPSHAYNQYLGLAALLHLSFGILITIGFIWS